MHPLPLYMVGWGLESTELVQHIMPPSIVERRAVDKGPCCALCPGVIEWHNCGIVLGVLESGLGIGWNKYLNSVTLYVGIGPL